MENLEKKLEQGLLGMTVYSPDVYYSGISEDIDLYIASQTGLIPVLRHQFNHSAASIERFYATGVHKNVPNWHHVVNFFTSAPSMVTFWYGKDAIEKLNSVKGRSHPAMASTDTVRGRFLCDNAVCNLIHTSDDVAEMIRELMAVECYGLLKTPFIKTPISSSFFSNGRKKLFHNGAYTLLKVLGRVANVQENITPNTDYNSLEFYDAVINKLQCAALKSSPQVRKLITSFLRGDETVVYELEKYGVTDEEKFIIACSASTRSGWVKQMSLYDVIDKLMEKLTGISGFFIGGSTAARLYGYKCLTDDIDVICTDEALQAIAERLELTVEIAEKSFGRYQFCNYICEGYDVEFSTMADYINDYKIVIDDEMLARSDGKIPLMPLEDIICELYSLGRTDYHNDIARAKQYRCYFDNSLDKDYLERRFIESGIGIECYLDLMS